MLKIYCQGLCQIYCQGCWLILEDIETIFLKKTDMWLCSGVFFNDDCFTDL